MTLNRHLAALVVACLMLGFLASGQTAAADPPKPSAEADAKKAGRRMVVKKRTETKQADSKTEKDAAKPAVAPSKKIEQPKKIEAKKVEAKEETKKEEAPKSEEAKKTEEPKVEKPVAAKSKGDYLSRLFKKTIVKKADAPKEVKEPKKTDIAKTDAAKTVKKPAVASTKQPVVVHLTLRGSYPEGPSTDSPLGEMKASLGSLIEKFDALAVDKEVAAVVLEIENLSLGGGKVNEVRQAIRRVRAGGKPVVAMLSDADAGAYLVACACDEIAIAPSGTLIVPGVRAEVMFYKGLLDKIGVKADVLQMGKFKGAGEPYIRTGMSPALRESYEAVVDDSFDRLVAIVAKERKLKDYKVKTLIDQGLFTASDAKKAGLVDQTLYADEVFDRLCRRLKASSLRLVTKYKSKDRSKEFSGVAGMMKLAQVLLGGRAEKIDVRSDVKKIAVIYAVGPIVQGKSESGLLGGNSLGSATMVEAIREANKDPNVVAVVLRIDSPGGSAIASDLIWREIVRTKKPFVASMGDVAGSGGYYIAMAADRIYAEPSTLTGSIGVIGGKAVTEGLYRKLGLTTEVVSRGQNSGLLSNDKPFTPSEREAWLTSMKEIYRQFVAKSAKGRNMKFDDLEALAQGRIYTGNMAVKNGLVDRLGTLHDAIAHAKKSAGVAEGEKVEVLVLPKPKSILEELFGDPSASMGEDARAVVELLGPLADARVLQRLFAEPVLTLMPYRVELK